MPLTSRNSLSQKRNSNFLFITIIIITFIIILNITYIMSASIEEGLPQENH